MPGPKPLAVLCLCLGLCLSAPTRASEGLDGARDLIEQGRFAEAYQALYPLAQSGNADAEHLIGVIHGLGVGAAPDPQRAFDWVLRAAMKGHAGAQTSLGWHYEAGQGLPAPDRVRALAWYRLAVIGGDPKAAPEADRLAATMTAQEIEKAHGLVDDYRGWIYPLR